MERPSGTAAVRLTLWTLLVASFAMALVQPVQGGTLEAPEIQDPAGDQALFGEVPTDGEAGGGMDLITIWIDNDTAAGFDVNIVTTAGVSGGTGVSGTPAGNVLVTSDTYHVNFVIGAAEFTATVTVQGGTMTLSNAANAAVIVEGVLKVNILKSAVGDPAAGTALTGFHVQADRGQTPIPFPVITDVAPNTGAEAGVSYTFTGGGGSGPCPNCTADDTDGDGLNDTWEQQYFGNLTENATGDPDGDGLTNGQEEALGTDPTEADSDGDGVNDKDDPFPLDPSRGGTSSGTSTTGTSTRPTTTSRSGTSTTGSTTTGGDDDGGVNSFGDAVDRLESDPGYLGLSGGGFLAVLVLCIIALAVRWSL